MNIIYIINIYQKYKLQTDKSRHQDALHQIASTLTDQFRVLGGTLRTHTFMTYSTDTMRLISHVDKFTCLILMMLSITADKEKILQTCKRQNIGVYHNHVIQWLEMDIPRRWTKEGKIYKLDWWIQCIMYCHRFQNMLYFSPQTKNFTLYCTR